ncbi:MAG: phosphoribosylanthranilate isomerase [Gemmatimonadaceae bacterium]
MAELKFCGLTRAADAALVPRLGGSFAGAIFAGGPRTLTAAKAREVFAPLSGTGVRRVGVFGAASLDEIDAIAVTVGLDVLQLSGAVTFDTCVVLRARFAGEIWPVVRIRPDAGGLPSAVAAWYEHGADAVVLDARVEGRLGGTGVALDWAAIAGDVAKLRAHGRVVLAGGLRPDTVARAVSVVVPDVVDVSSGVERTPGIKDPELMRAFAAAIGAHEV